VVDKSPMKGLSYYRLVTTNYNGLKRYSDIKAVNFTGELIRSIEVDNPFPNPFDDHFSLNYTIHNDGLVRFILFTEEGRIVSTREEMVHAGNNTFEYSPDNYLSRGTYILNVIFDNKAVTKKVNKK
jgi:hypothetical protein